MKCKGKVCGGSRFDFKNVRYYCEACTKFYCEKCCWRGDYYEDKSSDKKERPVCFCTSCLAEVHQAEHELDEAMKGKEFHHLNKVLSRILASKVDIDVKKKYDAERLHL